MDFFKTYCFVQCQVYYTGSYLSDDNWHTFNLRRRADHLELWVDSQRHQTGTVTPENN